MDANRNLPDLHEGSEVMMTVKDSERGDKRRGTRIEVLPQVRGRRVDVLSSLGAAGNATPLSFSMALQWRWTRIPTSVVSCVLLTFC